MTSYGTCMLCGVLSYFVSGVTFFFLFFFLRGRRQSTEKDGGDKRSKLAVACLAESDQVLYPKRGRG